MTAVSTPPLMSYEQSVQWLRRQPERQRLVRDAYLDEDPLVACRRFEQSEEFAETLKLLRLRSQARLRLLDLGAGNGIASYAFARRGLEVVAVEPGPSAEVGAAAIRGVSKAAGLAIDVHEAYGEKLPLADDSFDIIYGRQVLHHALNLQKMIAEAARVLKPGGILLAVREHVVNDEDQLRQFLDQHPLHRWHQGENAYRLEVYLAALHKAGLKLLHLLHPWASVINFAPRSKREWDTEIELTFRRKFGPLGAALSRLRVFRACYVARRGRRDRSPGRLYSFLARKAV